MNPMIDGGRDRVKQIARRLLKPFGAGRVDGIYGASYFGEGRDPLDRMGLSGYEHYGRDTSNADIAAYLVWRHFPVQRTLDVGCALGFVVAALRELGIEAQGCDVSHWAIAQADATVRPHLRRADLTARLPYADRQFELVTALETLEHLPPDAVAHAVAELTRVSSGWVVCTIPSIGRNDSGPDGFPNSKVRDERLDHYLALGREYDGPVPYDDLARDAQGEPIEGHVSIASYRWWTRQFEAAGLARAPDVERRLHPFLARFDLTEFWNLYVFRHLGTPDPPAVVRPVEDQRGVEHRWRLGDRRAGERATMFLRAGLGDDAAPEVPA